MPFKENEQHLAKDIDVLVGKGVFVEIGSIDQMEITQLVMQYYKLRTY